MTWIKELVGGYKLAVDFENKNLFLDVPAHTKLFIEVTEDVREDFELVNPFALPLDDDLVSYFNCSQKVASIVTSDYLDFFTKDEN